MHFLSTHVSEFYQTYATCVLIYSTTWSLCIISGIFLSPPPPAIACVKVRPVICYDDLTFLEGIPWWISFLSSSFHLAIKIKIKVYVTKWENLKWVILRSIPLGGNAKTCIFKSSYQQKCGLFPAPNHQK